MSSSSPLPSPELIAPKFLRGESTRPSPALDVSIKGHQSRAVSFALPLCSAGSPFGAFNSIQFSARALEQTTFASPSQRRSLVPAATTQAAMVTETLVLSEPIVLHLGNHGESLDDPLGFRIKFRPGTLFESSWLEGGRRLSPSAANEENQASSSFSVFRAARDFAPIHDNLNPNNVHRNQSAFPAYIGSELSKALVVDFCPSEGYFSSDAKTQFGLMYPHGLIYWYNEQHFPAYLERRKSPIFRGPSKLGISLRAPLFRSRLSSYTSIASSSLSANPSSQGILISYVKLPSSQSNLFRDSANLEAESEISFSTFVPFSSLASLSSLSSSIPAFTSEFGFSAPIKSSTASRIGGTLTVSSPSPSLSTNWIDGTVPLSLSSASSAAQRNSFSLSRFISLSIGAHIPLVPLFSKPLPSAASTPPAPPQQPQILDQIKDKISQGTEEAKKAAIKVKQQIIEATSDTPYPSIIIKDRSMNRTEKVPFKVYVQMGPEESDDCLPSSPSSAASSSNNQNFKRFLKPITDLVAPSADGKDQALDTSSLPPWLIKADPQLRVSVDTNLRANAAVQFTIGEKKPASTFPFISSLTGYVRASLDVPSLFTGNRNQLIKDSPNVSFGIGFGSLPLNPARIR